MWGTMTVYFHPGEQMFLSNLEQRFSCLESKHAIKGFSRRRFSHTSFVCQRLFWRGKEVVWAEQDDLTTIINSPALWGQLGCNQHNSAHGSDWQGVTPNGLLTHPSLPRLSVYPAQLMQLWRGMSLLSTLSAIQTLNGLKGPARGEHGKKFLYT